MQLLYALIAFELFVGGGGRLFEIGPVTARMVLFAIAMLVIGMAIWTRPHRRGGFLIAFLWVFAYLAIHIPAFLRGTVNGFSAADAFADLQPTLYWLAAPFFALAVENPKNIERTQRLVVLAGLVLAVAYLATIASVVLGYISPIDLWIALLPTGEFFFRNEILFFYKGDLYLGIAIIFLLSFRHIRFGILALIGTALLLTLTRGFLLAGFVAAILMFTYQRRWRAVFYVLSFTFSIFVFVQILLSSVDPAALGDRAGSDSVRLDDLSYMVNHATIGTLLIGEGFGALINARMNVETSYLWLLWKGGILTLAFWVLPLVFSFHWLRNVPRKSADFQPACAFFFSIVFIYVQTMTNPFLNNPIGLSFVIIGMFCLRKFAGNSRSSQTTMRSPAQPDLQRRLGLSA